MRNRNTTSTAGTLRRGLVSNSMRSVSTKSLAANNLFFEGIPCGDQLLRRHKNGYPLASLNVLRPILYQKRVFRMFECAEASIQSYVDYTVKIVRNNFGIGSSPTNQSSTKIGMLTASFRASSRRLTNADAESQASQDFSQTPRLKLRKTKYSAKGGARLVIDNNTLHLFKGMKKKISVNSTYSEKSLKKSIRFNWMHIYSVDKNLDENSFTLVFYEGRDDDFLKKKSYSSDSYLFKVVTIKPKEASEVGAILGEVYNAVRAQAQVSLETAKSLTTSKKEKERGNAEAFFRLCVDLLAVTDGAEDKSSLEALDGLITHLEQNADENSDEIEFWVNRREDLEGALKEKQLEGDAVHGVLL